jgi:hypothetical protein
VKNQQLQDVARQKSTTRFRVNNQLMIDGMSKFYANASIMRVANGLQLALIPA